jgi:hypothetical protein
MLTQPCMHHIRENNGSEETVVDKKNNGDPMVVKE